MAYPFYENLQNLSRNMIGGNFGLWYNKFIPIADFDHCKASDDRGNENEAVSCYEQKYRGLRKDDIKKLIDKKHADQSEFCKSFSSKYNHITITAKLKTPLITGIGESHPHEVSMVFEHNLGIPYIPASGMKGIVRFAHTYALWKEGIPEEYLKTDKKTGLEYIDDESYEAIYYLFGNQKMRGKVIFLDAYPENVPDLHIDIMNPHYAPYYSEGQAPADCHNPTPIKFLTVAKDTVFIFRAVAQKTDDIPQKVKEALNKALTEEGVGAKTAVGYGIFDICENKDETVAVKVNAQPKVEIKPVDKFISAIRNLKPNDAGPINSKIDEALKKLESEEDKKAFTQAVKAHMGKSFKKSKAEAKLAQFLS
jgi:CRISPR-associated RAMP protein, Cmr6 family